MRVQTVTRNGIARISMDPNPERSTCDGVEVAQHDRPATLSSSSPSSPQWLLTRTRFHVPRRPPSNRSPRLTRNQNGGGSIHRSPFDGPPDGSVPDWSRGEERTGKTATGPISPRSVRVRTYSEASRGGWVFAPSLSLSLFRSARDDFATRGNECRVRSDRSIVKRAHERVEIFRITTSPSRNGFVGRVGFLLLVEESLAKLFDLSKRLWIGSKESNGNYWKDATFKDYRFIACVLRFAQET